MATLPFVASAGLPPATSACATSARGHSPRPTRPEVAGSQWFDGAASPTGCPPTMVRVLSCPSCGGAVVPGAPFCHSCCAPADCAPGGPRRNTVELAQPDSTHWRVLLQTGMDKGGPFGPPGSQADPRPEGVAGWKKLGSALGVARLRRRSTRSAGNAERPWVWEMLFRSHRHQWRLLL
jgi:hypothetical protein